MVPKDTYIRIAPLHLLVIFKRVYGITPSLVLATRSIRPVTLMFSRSLIFKNVRPKVLYFSLACAGHWHTVRTPAQSAVLPLCESELKHVDWEVCAVCQRPHSSSSFCLLTAWSSFILPGRDSLIRVLDWRQPLQVSHLFGCCCLKWFQMTFPFFIFHLILFSYLSLGSGFRTLFPPFTGIKLNPPVWWQIYCHDLSNAN